MRTNNTVSYTLRYFPTLPGFGRADSLQSVPAVHQPALQCPDLLYLHQMAQQYHINGLAPTTRSTYPRLQQILKKIRKDQAATHPPKVRLPITLQILQDIKCLLSGKPQSYTIIMTWAACCLTFFGFLRVSEFTIPSQKQYDQSCHLSLGDISLDNRDTLRLLRIHLKQSKTDPFRRGVEIYLGVTDDSTCSLKGILPYLALRGT